jgi:predicted transcriptional regulator
LSPFLCVGLGLKPAVIVNYNMIAMSFTIALHRPQTIDRHRIVCQFFGMAGRSTRARNPAIPKKDSYSRREREIMDTLYKLGKASAAQILEQIPDPPTYTAIRSHLTILEKKGHVRHSDDGTRYIYEPLVAREQMGHRAIDSLLKTFFDNSVERAVTALLTRKDADVSADDLDRLSRLIEKAKKEGR